jgi:hypothetical protein
MDNSSAFWIDEGSASIASNFGCAEENLLIGEQFAKSTAMSGE